MTARRLATALTATTMLTLVADVALRQIFPGARGSVDGLTLLPMVLGLAAVGGVVALRRSENIYGWLLAGIGLTWMLNSLTIDYAALAVARGYPAADATAVVAVVTASASWGTFVTFVLLLYPTGHLPTRRWRWVGFVAGAGVLLMTIGLSWSAVQNGAGVVVAQFAAGSSVQESGGAKLVNEVGHVGVFFGLLAGVVALFVRRRRADAVERLQLKWFASGAAAVAVSILVAPLVPGLEWLEIVALSAMPVVIGIAILRWHLYDIDRIVSRTLAYALLTILLVGIYVGAVTALTAITAPVTRESPVAVAAATLAAAAAFQPARRRIQTAVDHRFNRARYDERITVERFATSLRQEVDLDDVHTQLVGTVGEVLQPTEVRVWLHPGRATP